MEKLEVLRKLQLIFAFMVLICGRHISFFLIESLLTMSLGKLVNLILI